MTGAVERPFIRASELNVAREKDSLRDTLISAPPTARRQLGEPREVKGCSCEACRACHYARSACVVVGLPHLSENGCPLPFFTDFGNRPLRRIAATGYSWPKPKGALMHRFLAAMLFAIGCATPALADGPARRAAYDEGRPGISWAGYHVGVQGGASFWNTEHQFAGGVSSGDFDFSSGFAGVAWGSTWQRGALVYGFDSDFSFVSNDAHHAGPGCGAGTCFTEIEYFGTSRVRVGYAMDRALTLRDGRPRLRQRACGQYDRSRF